MLIELPDGDWLDPQAVRGITLLDDLQHGPRVRIDLAEAIQLKMVEFDNPDAACYLDAGKALQALPAWEVAQFPWRLLKERGLLDEADALTVKVDAIRCGLRKDRPAAGERGE